MGSACFVLNSSEGLFLNHENFGDGTRAESWATGDGLLGGHFDRCGLWCQTGLDFRVAQTVQVESSVVVGTSIDFFGVSAETGLVVESDLEDGAERASVLAGITVHANVILAAVVGMGVATEGSGFFF